MMKKMEAAVRGQSRRRYLEILNGKAVFGLGIGQEGGEYGRKQKRTDGWRYSTG